MKNIFLYCFFLVLCSCTQQSDSPDNDSEGNKTTSGNKEEVQDAAKLIDAIAYLETDLASSTDGKMNPALAKELIEKSELFATLYKDDPKSPDYLFRAADVAKGIGMPDRAIEIWETLKTTYPDHEKVPPALFLQGFTWENDFNNYEKAKNVYLEFLEKYPDHALAVQVKSVLNTLGVPPEELVKSFQKK